MIVNAYAGTGKTHTAVHQIFHAAQQDARLNFLVLMFNKAIREEFCDRAHQHNESLGVDRLECFVSPANEQGSQQAKCDRLRIKTSDGNSQSAACKWYASDGRRTITFDRPGSKGTTFDDESGCTAAVEHFLNDSRPLVAESVWKTLVFWIQSDEPKPTKVLYKVTDRWGKAAEKKDMGIEPLWLHLAECAWLHLLSLGCLRRHTTWAIVTKALQLVTRYPPGPGYGQADPIAWTRAALETAGVKPLDVPESLPGGGGRPVQLVIDEAQDLNRAQVFDLYVTQQRRCSRILYGDRHQAIYAFRGASGVSMLPPTGVPCIERSLTQSLRFGSPVAELATLFLQEVLLHTKPRHKPPVLGLFKPDARVLPASKRGRYLVPRGSSSSSSSSSASASASIGAGVGDSIPVVLCRSNVGVVKEALLMTSELASAGKTPLWMLFDEKGKREFATRSKRLVNIVWLAKTELDEALPRNCFVEYRGEKLSTFQSLIEAADEKDWTEIEGEIEFARGYPNTPEVFVEQVKLAMTRITTDKAKADVEISTAHKYKGREADIVVMSTDYEETLTDPIDLAKAPGPVHHNKLTDGTNVIYVAMTRAKKVLILNQDLDSLINHLYPPTLVPRVGGGGDEDVGADEATERVSEMYRVRWAPADAELEHARPADTAWRDSGLEAAATAHKPGYRPRGVSPAVFSAFFRGPRTVPGGYQAYESTDWQDSWRGKEHLFERRLV